MGRPAVDQHRESGAELELVIRCEAALRRTALRWSLCADDADDAFQRAVEILLGRAVAGRIPINPVAWMHTVVRHEALAVRSARERLLAGGGDDGVVVAADHLDHVASARCGPAERAELRARFEAMVNRLRSLKPAERLAIGLQACGYSYAEIASACGWTRTKVNRSLAEGRAKLRAERETAPAECGGGS